jgi:hypothetical protein
MDRSLTDDAVLAAALAGCPEDLALACQAALKTLEASGDVPDADRSFREFALAFAALAGVSARATCTAPNCVGHRVRA